MYVKYPSCDFEFNKNYYPIYIKVARKIISNFPLLDSLFENFNGSNSLDYDKLDYKKAQNKIFKICTYDLKTRLLSCYYNLPPKERDSEILSRCVDNNTSNFKQLYDLKHALSIFKPTESRNESSNSFKSKFLSNNYFDSKSAYLEIITAYKIGSKIGFKNIKLEPRLKNNKKPDIKIFFNNKIIYAELSIINKSQATETIEAVLNIGAKHLYKKISDKYSKFTIQIYTLKLPLDSDCYIDTKKSEEFLCERIDGLYLEELSGLNLTLHLTCYSNIDGIKKYFDCYLIDLPKCYLTYGLECIYDNKQIHNWAKKVKCADLFDGLFAHISTQTNTRNVAVLCGSNLYSEHDESNPNPPPITKTAQIEMTSFLDQIERKINSKIKKHQFEDGHPVLFLICGKLWFKEIDCDRDWLDITKLITKLLSYHSCITGVLFYLNGYNHYRYIPNPNADENIKLSESEIESIFPKEDTHE